MIFVLNLTLLLVFHFLFAGELQAAPPNPKKEMVKKILQISGIVVDAQGFQKTVMVQFYQALKSKQINPDDHAPFIDEAMKLTDPRPFLNQMARSFFSGLTEKEMKEILAWYDSPAGTELGTLSKENSEALNSASTMTWPPPQTDDTSQRLALIEQTHQAMGLDQSVLEDVLGMQKMLSRVLIAFTPADQRQPLADADRRSDASRAELGEAIKKENLKGTFLMFQKTPLATLQKQLDFVRSPAGQKYYQVWGKAKKDNGVWFRDKVYGELSTFYERRVKE